MVLVKVGSNHIKDALRERYSEEEVGIVKSGVFMTKKKDPNVSAYIYIGRGHVGGMKPPKERRLHIANAIWDEVEDRFYYPDRLYISPMPEAMLVTRADNPLPTPSIPSSMKLGDLPLLYDAEASYVYQELSKVYYSNQIAILMIPIKDSKDAIDATNGSYYQDEFYEDLFGYIDTLIDVRVDELMDMPHPMVEMGKEIYLNKLIVDLKCSESMKVQLTQLWKYWSAKNIPIEIAIERLKCQGMLPAKSKREGLMILDELKSQLL
ncbi:MAG: hypothetical protein K5656_00640 [Lachnospiraceae bacterium]|nr:hypothetical protein [Lachnospiraceae bacterium]